MALLSDVPVAMFLPRAAGVGAPALKPHALDGLQRAENTPRAPPRCGFRGAPLVLGEQCRHGFWPETVPVPEREGNWPQASAELGDRSHRCLVWPPSPAFDGA